MKRRGGPAGRLDNDPVEPVAEMTAELLQSFAQSDSLRGADQTDMRWLASEFRKHAGVWQSDGEIEAAAREVVDAMQAANARKAA